MDQYAIGTLAASFAMFGLGYLCGFVAMKKKMERDKEVKNG